MLLKKNEKTVLILGLVVVVAAVIACVWIWNRQPDTIAFKPADNTITPSARGQEKTAAGRDIAVRSDGTIEGKIVVKPEIDYGDLEKNNDLKSMMGERKEKLGIDQSLDMIVNSDESFTVGKTKIAMSDILKKAFTKEGGVFEERIEKSGEIRPETVKQYGIYVVQPGDNIWNIHFNILKEYYQNRGIHVSPKADEPGNQGMSSGVGKILKFSENMVTIYNLHENKIDTNIDLIEPLSKVVVYNMDEVFSLLRDVNYENIDRIQFDGKSIWIPAVK